MPCKERRRTLRNWLWWYRPCTASFELKDLKTRGDLALNEADRRVGGGALARWPPSAAHTARADFPHAAFTKTQVFRDAKEGMNPTRWSINEWTFLAPVRLIQSTSLLGHGRTGFSLKELFRPPISLLIWCPFSS